MPTPIVPGCRIEHADGVVTVQLHSCDDFAPKGDARDVALDFGGGLLTLSNFNKATRVDYPEGFHVGFIQESPERVNEINKVLKGDGFDVEAPRNFHGSWTFYFRAPGGFTIEILSERVSN